MSRPLFTVVIPTIGRWSLPRTLESIDRRLAEIIVVQDTHGPLLSDVRAVCAKFGAVYHALDAGAHDTGSPQLHLGFHLATGEYVLNCGDDDVYEAGAFDVIAEALDPNDPIPLMFKVEMHPNEQRGNRRPVVLWAHREIERFNVTGQGFVCPNLPSRMGRWVDDVTFMRETVALYGGRVEWRDEVIAQCY